MCMDGIDACFAGLPLFGELPSGWRRLELDYEMEASPRNLMLVPPICTATVYYSGRAVVPVEYLKKRVREIVRANPWLGGRLRKGFGRPFLAIPKSPMEDHFVECKDALSINPGMCFRDLVGHVQMSSATLKCGLACLNRNEQLFRVAVLPAQPDHFLLVVSLNHTIGDGFTFYKLCGMLDSAVICQKQGWSWGSAQEDDLTVFEPRLDLDFMKHAAVMRSRTLRRAEVGQNNLLSDEFQPEPWATWDAEE
ncbi:unnamed protein product [Durusdinium trenchii]|uniref:Uncharacterized protein n=1 Tax=Durusdinium trenchii TaxID=1381693 RepID=A0ABP0MSG1_9DINO